jgi:hypothetical protein
LEFFTLVSRELQKKDLHVWWDDNPSSAVTTTSTAIPPSLNSDNSKVSALQEDHLLTGPSKDVDYVFCPGGLFPAPLR